MCTTWVVLSPSPSQNPSKQGHASRFEGFGDVVL